jgi:hypothetical protein
MTSETRTFAEAAALLPDDFYLKCAKHFLKAVRKHPKFADKLFLLADLARCQEILNETRALNNLDAERGNLPAECLLTEEIYEASEAWIKKDETALVSELYDAVAVLMRMIAVVEGRQKLGGEK